MADADHEQVELLSEDELTDQSFDMSEVLMAAVSEFLDGRTPDARVVAAACGLVAGSYLYGIPDMEVRRWFVDQWVEKLRVASGTQPQ